MAQNILVFLKAKCTQEGHTYWLFRRQGEDAIKLYDLTSLDCFKVTNPMVNIILNTNTVGGRPWTNKPIC